MTKIRVDHPPVRFSPPPGTDGCIQSTIRCAACRVCAYGTAVMRALTKAGAGYPSVRTLLIRTVALFPRDRFERCRGAGARPLGNSATRCPPIPLRFQITGTQGRDAILTPERIIDIETDDSTVFVRPQAGSRYRWMHQRKSGFCEFPACPPQNTYPSFRYSSLTL